MPRNEDDPIKTFYSENGYLERTRKETGEERAQRIKMALYGSQYYAKGGAVERDRMALYGSQYYADGGLAQLLKKLANKAGKFQASRAEQAADLVDTSKFNERAFEKMFVNPGSGLYTTMPPTSFEHFSRPLSPLGMEANPYPRWDSVPRSAVPKKFGAATYDAYIDNISNLIDKRGMPEPPTLWLSPLNSVRELSEIEGHEGRHRMRALQRQGEKNALVRMAPANQGDARGTAEEAYARMMERYFPKGGDDLFMPERSWAGHREPLPFPGKPFGGGGVVDDLVKLLGKLRPKGSGYVPQAGKPATVKIPGVGEVEARPLPEATAAAEAYMRRMGLGGHDAPFVPLNEDFGRAVGSTFDAMPNAPGDPRVRRAYDTLIDETMGQYRSLKDAGYDFHFNKPGAGDPYARSPSLGYADLVNNGRLSVFPTLDGFGSGVGDSSKNPLLIGVGKIGDMNNATANDAFRIVHDMYGHFGLGNPFFRAPGEERAYQPHSRMYGPEARQAAATETRGQNSWVNFGPHSGANKGASGADTIYAPQTVNLLPDWAQAIDPGWPYPSKYSIGGAVRMAGGGGIKFVKNLLGGVDNRVLKAIREIENSTAKTGNEALMWGRTPIETPEQWGGVKGLRESDPEGMLSQLVKGDRASVDFPPRYFDDIRSENDRLGVFFTAHTHPSGVPIPSGQDIMAWAQPAVQPHQSFQNMYVKGFGDPKAVVRIDPSSYDPSVRMDNAHSVMNSRWNRPWAGTVDERARDWVQNQPWLMNTQGPNLDQSWMGISQIPYYNKLARHDLMNMSIDDKARFPGTDVQWSDVIPDLLKHVGDYADGGHIQ